MGASTVEKAGARRDESCCDIRISIDCAHDVNIYNCSTTAAPAADAPAPGCPPGFPPIGACLPAVPGAKHKVGRDRKLARLAAGARVPSALAAATLHLVRRFLLGKTAANPLEARAYTTLRRMSRDLLACTVSAFDAVPPQQRGRLFASSLLLDPDVPLDAATLTAALGQEIVKHVGVEAFDDPQGVEERPGRIRVYEPQGEDFFSQVRICSVNGLRTANFIPVIAPGDYLPAEVQQDCEPKIVDGQPQVVCQVRTADCPGHQLTGACARVLDIASGDSVVLEGVNYFSVDAKVRFSDRHSGTPLRDVDAHVRGDVDTPVTEVVDGATVLLNDCRVHDRLTFRVPDDLAPGVYQIQVVVPNVTGIAALGAEIASHSEFINVVPPSTARFRIVSETIRARRETSPQSLGSDEVGLRTLAFPLFADGSFGSDEPHRIEQKFEDIQDVDFDSGTRRDITRNIFEHEQPILGVALVVTGDEIDSQRAYDQQITSSTDFFVDLIKEQAAFVKAAVVALGGVAALTKFGTIGAIVAGIAAVITLGVDIVVALWAPADPIIRDSIGLSVTDLAALTSANAPAPAPRTFTAADGIVVNVNKTIPPVKLPFEYHETREYVSDDEDSRYELTFRYNRIV